jgi:hypothetical protein
VPISFLVDGYMRSILTSEEKEILESRVSKLEGDVRSMMQLFSKLLKIIEVKMGDEP